ncbi:MAG: Rod shape-determining protein mreB [Candidatus Moranbacteria bacterium GW2011_GWE1_35_17]|nr:MAG: Rod shape-determining protein mreB [Candidatus Moranbacteria bacterium GW2011_GWE1_35_17]KKP81484.1 MAG: Rod shape-determining protein mreB [Candidatus Moranbacteria bacterium GW2011_GWF1_35_5]KKP84520.1 MAG: Rod shape-determining protein mreB [Candidatus Moranbacteria bacterium GW2011_GWF2_35_54]
MFIKKIGIDLGTANVVVFVPGKGIVVNEPSVVAVSLLDNKVLAVGIEAKEMIGRTPDTIVAIKPLKDGVIADYRVTEAMLKYFIGKVSGKFRIFRPEVMLSVPAGITSTEKRAAIDAAIKAGAKAAYVVKEPILAAIGAEIPIHEPHGSMIINIGGGTSEVAVISLGGIVSACSARVGGNKFDNAIADYIKRKHGLAIGDRTAEMIKIKIGSALAQVKEDYMDIKGRDLSGRLPKTIRISSNEVTEALQDELRDVINAIKKVLQDTPPELAADIMDKGMILSGGGALLRNLDKLISKTIDVPCYVADDPLFCVARGTGKALENLDIYKKTLVSSR